MRPVLLWLVSGRFGLAVVLLAFGAAVGHAQPAVQPNQAAAGLGEQGAAFPAEWPVQDFNFTMLEPAAGASTSPSLPTPVTPTSAGLAAQTYRIDQLSRTTVAPSGTQPMALPPAVARSATTSSFQPLPQAFKAPTGGVAADLGIVVNEQPVAGVGSGVAGLAAYGPLAAAVPEGVWLRAPQATHVRQLRSAMAQPLRSEALRDEWRTVLLAAAAAPQTGEGQPHWLAMRAEMLEQFGLYDAAWSLWREVGPLLRDPALPAELRQGWARASLLAGQHERACSAVREQAAAGMVSEFWPSAAAVCAAVELVANGGGSADGAALGLAIQLLPPSVLKADPALVAALGAVRDNQPPRLGNWPVGSLAGATLAAVPGLVSASQVAGWPDVALRRLQASSNLPLALRAEAALQLAGQTGNPADAAQWLALASSPTLPATPARQWPDAVLLAWAKAFVQAQVNDPSATLPPQTAALVVPAALRLGELNTALAWWGPYRAQEGLDQAALRARWQTYLALQLAQQQNVSATLAAWSAVRGTDPTAAQRVLAVVAGLGHPVDAQHWAAVAREPDGQGDALNLAWQNLVQEAAQQPDRVAVLAMVSEALRGQNAAAASPAVLQAALAALRTVGLPQVALRLAAEALTLPPTSAVRVLKMAEPVADSAALPAALSPSVPQPMAPLGVKAPQPPSLTAPKPPLLPKPQV